MTKPGYCIIEKTMTNFKKLENGKWLCVSPGCSMVSPQVKEPPIKPYQVNIHKQKMNEFFNSLRRKQNKNSIKL